MPVSKSTADFFDQLNKVPSLSRESFAPVNSRIPLCVCVDTSYSMGAYRDKEGKSTVERGVADLIIELKASPETKDTVDICILTFGDKGVTAYSSDKFISVSSRDADIHFDFSGGSPMYEAVETAIDKVRECINTYTKNKKTYEHGWVILFSDSQADDTISAGKSKARRVADINRKKSSDIRIICGCYGRDTGAFRDFAAYDDIQYAEEYTHFSDYIKMLSHSLRMESKSQYAGAGLG